MRWSLKNGWAAALVACGPTANPPGGAMEGGGAATTIESESSTGSPVPVCDPLFDSGLAHGEPIWTRSFSIQSESRQFGRAVAVDANGWVYAAGRHKAADGGDDGWLHILDADGRPMTEVRHDGAASLNDEFVDVALLPTGGAVVVGFEAIPSSGTSNIADLLVMLSYSPDGVLLWRSQLTGFEEIYRGSVPPRVTTSDDGRIVAGATVQIEGGVEATLFWELAQSGTLIRGWSVPPDGHQTHQLRDMKLDRSGILWVAGSGASTSGGEDLEFVGRWDETGAFLGAWEREFGGAAAREVEPLDDGALVLGWVHSRETLPYVTRPILRRYAADGSELWAHVVEMSGEETLHAYDLATDCDGRALVRASLTPDATDWMFVVDDEGAELERRELIVDDYMGIYDLATDPFGNVVGVGGRNITGRSEFVVRKYAR